MQVSPGDTAFVLISAALVLLMTPGLAFFYGGMVRRINVLNTLMLCYIAMAVVGVIWVLAGYSLAFAPQNGMLGSFIGSLDWWGLEGVGVTPNATYAPTIPHLSFMAFQGMFAIITPALISGALVERLSLKSYVWFVGLWSLLVYTPIAHSVWGDGGWLRGMGALDFAGGTVVHISAGFSALVGALVLGPRKGLAPEQQTGHNLPFVLLGASLLWFGWFGFNAGSALGANGIAALAFVTTNAAAASAALVWMTLDYWKTGKVTAVGAATGAVAGLVAVTPAAGFVSPMSALLIGAISAVVCESAIILFRKRLQIDDSLDAFSVHGVGGVVGALATGIFASKAINPAGADGVLTGNAQLFTTQLITVAVTAAFAAIGSFAILKVLDSLLGLRVREHVEREGLDDHYHGQKAYEQTGILSLHTPSDS